MPAIHHRWTAADVRALMDESRAWPRFELIGGELLVTPAPGARHQGAIAELLAILGRYVDAQGVGVAYAAPADLELIKDTITQPDVFVVPFGAAANAEPEWRWDDVGSLLLAVEIISPSSIRTDRVEKRDFYMEAGVPDYWVVDLDARLLEWWRRERDRPEVVLGPLSWRPAGARDPLGLDVRELLAVVDRRYRLVRGR